MSGAAAREAYAYLVPEVRDLHRTGESLRGIARIINGKGHTCRGGGPFGPVQIKRIIDRYCGVGSC